MQGNQTNQIEYVVCIIETNHFISKKQTTAKTIKRYHQSEKVPNRENGRDPARERPLWQQSRRDKLETVGAGDAKEGEKSMEETGARKGNSEAVDKRGLAFSTRKTNTG